MFGSFFSSFFGRDCSEIEADPRADVFEREICRNMKQFEESFQEFSYFSPHQSDEDIHVDPFNGRGQEQEDNDPQSLRDHILSPPPSSSPPRQSEAPFNDQHIFSPLPHFDRRRRPDHNGEDKDLDDIIKNNPEQLERILKKPPPTPRYNNDDDVISSRSQSVIISTIQKPDGSIEQRRTVRDSDGNEETTVTTTPPYSNHESSSDIFDRNFEHQSSSLSSSYFKRLSDWLWDK